MKELAIYLSVFIVNTTSWTQSNHPEWKVGDGMDRHLLPIYRENPAKDTLLTKRDIHYFLRDSKAASQQLYTEEQLKIILALNRIDVEHLDRVDTLVIPNEFFSDFNIYSPFPVSVDALKGVDKIVFFSYPIQAFGVYEYGTLVRWGAVSMGKETTPTPTGLFHTNWKKKRAVSTINSSWIMYWYFNLDNFRGVSMHQYDLPGYPASHACLRLSEEDAIWLYNYCNSWVLDKDRITVYGTPVIIYGEYRFHSRKPWLNLSDSSSANDISESDLKMQFEEFKPQIMQRQASRMLNMRREEP